jgi:UDP-N-acetylglucosamine acyltransferase
LVGLKRKGYNPEDLQSLKAAFRLLYRQDLSLSQAIEAIQPLLNNPNVKHLHSFLTAAMDTGRRGLIPGK